MRPGEVRRLTPAEQALAREMFGESLDSARVRLFAIPLWRRAFVPNGRLIAWPAVAASRDFGGASTPLSIQAVFVHELTHVWQAQQGINLLKAKLATGDGRAAYAYDLDDGCAFRLRNIEQQAMVMEHAFLARRGVKTPYPPAAYAAALGDRELA